MSFSAELKNELSKVIDNARHCRIAELAAFVCLSGRLIEAGLLISTESEAETEACLVILKRLYGYDAVPIEKKSRRNTKLHTIRLDLAISMEVMEAVKAHTEKERIYPDIPLLTHKRCCAGAFLRGAFIAAGSVSDPDRYYHFEIICAFESVAEAIANMMNGFGLNAKVTKRQKSFVVYLKEIEQISEAIGLMGARTSLFSLENSRILREMRGNVNRRVNCETANINKAARAAARQIEDIKYIQTHVGLNSLPDGLDEIAELRLKYPEATLTELGICLTVPIGKSGVNHRLRKLSSIAETLRSRGGNYYD